MAASTYNCRTVILALLMACVFVSGLSAADGAAAVARARTPAELVALIKARYLDERMIGLKGIAALTDDQKRKIVDQLMPLLGDKNWQTQLHAAQALGQIGTLAQSKVPDLVGLMKTALKNGDPGLFDLLGTTLARCKGSDPKDFKDLFTMMKTAMTAGKVAQYDKLASVLGAKGKDAVPTLVAMIKESDGVLLRQAISALAGLGKEATGAVNVLLAVGAKADTAMQQHIQKAIVAIKAANKPPVVAAVVAGCNEGKSTEITLPMTDADDLPFVLKAEIADQPKQGSTERKSALVFVYTSKAGFQGKDVFTWTGTDGQGKSAAMTCTVDVHPDTEGPKVVSVSGNGKTKLLVVFNEQVTQASAERAAAYSVKRGITVRAAAMRTDGKSVTLETSALTDAAEYTLTAAGIADRSKAHNAAKSTKTFTFKLAVPGLIYRYYETTAFDKLLKDSAAEAPKTTGVAVVFGKKKAERTDNYALDFSGDINVVAAGEYTFFTASDDGSHLWIDGKMIVDNAGMHGVQERSGKVKLSAGSHAIRVYFYQGGGGHDLFVRWQGPDIAKQEIPAAVLTHLPGAAE
ncbi:PA14 domain-containing protein [Verrucomicrobiota bacterium]